MSFHDYATLTSELNNMVATDPNGISALYDLGTTHDNNHILAVTIGKDNSNKSLFIGCHHANEWMSVEIPFLLARYLIDNYTDPVIRRLVDCRQIWIIPMVNPDGHEYSQSVRMWRKNRKFNGFISLMLPSDASLEEIYDATKDTFGPRNWEEIYDVNAGVLSGLAPPVSKSATSIVPRSTSLQIPCYGVDLNRNYDYKWGLTVDAHNSDQIDQDTYRGPSAGSEPEVQIIKKLMLRTLPVVATVIGSSPFRTVISYHTYGQLILYPWAYQNVAVSDPVTVDLADGMSDVTNLAGTRYKACYGTCSGTIYLTYGDFQDWVCNEFGIPAYTFEIDVTPMASTAAISRVFSVNLHAALALINSSHPSAHVTYDIAAPSSGSSYVRSGVSSPCDIAVGAHPWEIVGGAYPAP